MEPDEVEVDPRVKPVPPVPEVVTPGLPDRRLLHWVIMLLKGPGTPLVRLAPGAGDAGKRLLKVDGEPEVEGLSDVGRDKVGPLGRKVSSRLLVGPGEGNAGFTALGEGGS